MIRQFVIICVCAAAGRPAVADALGPDEPVPLTVAATVNEEPIYAGEVADLIRRLGLGEKVPEQQRPWLEAQTLGQIIERRIALHYLRRHRFQISDYHVTAAVADIRSKLEQKKSTLEKYLRHCGFTEKSLRAQLAWRMSWEKYVADRVTDDDAKMFFDANRRDFDGTKARIAHILIRIEKPADVGAAKSKAAAILKEILSSKLTFSEAAAKYSIAPTAERGGEIGLISRHGEMVEVFSAAAFALEKDEISQPVVSPFGVHLIRCIEIQPGDGKWTDVRDGLRSAIIQRGFRRIVAAERSRIKLAFTGRTPYFDPETGKLVSAASR